MKVSKPNTAGNAPVEVQKLPPFTAEYVDEPNDPKREEAVEEIMRKRGFKLGRNEE